MRQIFIAAAMLLPQAERPRHDDEKRDQFVVLQADGRRADPQRGTAFL